jgi:hypothetical protein
MQHIYHPRATASRLRRVRVYTGSEMLAATLFGGACALAPIAIAALLGTF